MAAYDKASILIVDDLQDKLLVFQSLLEDLGAQLVLVHSGAEALKAVLKQEFAVILLDVNMPDIDGFETASLIRRYKKSAHTPIIFITSYVDEIQAARGYSLGAVDYIVSPVVPDVLRTKVKVFVDLHRMQQQVRKQAEERVALARAEAARAAAEEANRRSKFLADASHVLGATIESGKIVQAIGDLVVPQLGDLCAIRLTDGEWGDAHTLLHWRRRDGTRHSEVLSPDAGFSDEVVKALHVALTRSVGQLVARAGVWRGAAESAGPAEAGSEPVPLESALVVPIVMRGKSAGSVVVADPKRRYEVQDLLLMEELASRAAIALDNARLYHNLQIEIAERKQVEEALREADQRKDEFLAMLSHELRNPLAPIRNAVELIRHLGVQEPKLEWARDLIDRQVGHLSRMVDELLDVSRISRGKITLKKETLDLVSILAQAVETTRPLIESRRHVLKVRTPPYPVWLKGDFVRLVQVFSNLLNNAAKYTEDGGEIEVKAAGEVGSATVSVRDSGIGISPELLPRVFELFTQADRALDRSQGGLGIGLTVVQRLVELHGGEVEARSGGVGHGSEFVVRLPCVTAVEANGATESNVSTLLPLRGIRILVVDDNADAAESVAMLLRLEGHEVQSAGDGVQAVELAQALRPQVVLLDIGLPGMDGYEVALRLRELADMQQTLFIALTGYGQEEDRTRSATMGFNHHLVKPADPQQIKRLIADWYDERMKHSSEYPRSTFYSA